MNLFTFIPCTKRKMLLSFFLLFLQGYTHAQTFNFPASDQSAILTGSDIYAHGLSDTVTVWCKDWVFIKNNPTTWGNTIKLKSNNTFVKFSVNDQNTLTDYLTPIAYTYRLTYQVYGYKNPSDTTTSAGYIVDNDTLTISFNNYADNTPYQNINLKKYSGFYKAMVIYTGLYIDTGSTLTPVSLTDAAWRNFTLEASNITQHYDKTQYVAGGPTVTRTEFAADNYINLSWTLPSTITPVSYELEWAYVDDYAVNPSSGAVTAIPAGSLNYNFNFNCTRVWLDSNSYRIPTTYPSGYIVYRVRAVRPDSQLYKYPIMGTWSGGSTGTPDASTVGALTSSEYYHISNAYAHDSLNWQYTVSFAEGGKYKHVMNFYDGLLKSRQSITRFNSQLNKLIVTDNIYDYEGRLSIKTLPAPVSATSFSYQRNVALNSVTNQPYWAADFDTGFSACPNNIPPPPLATNALANIYYSSHNPDTAGVQRYVPDAQGYPFVQTVFEPGFADRISKQGGAGPRLQIGDTNFISNSYVSPTQKSLNSLFGSNVGWQSFYTMTVSRDPNEQLSMSVKDYHGKLMASAMIGGVLHPATHAISPMTIPSPTYYKQDLLLPMAQAIDTIACTRIADKDYFNEAAAIDTLQYLYSLTPFLGCTGKYITVKAHYNSYITDQCGNKVISQDTILGSNGVVSSASPFSFTGRPGYFAADAAPYHVHKSLSVSPSDVEAAVDSFFNNANCFLTEPYFIKQSVDSATFPCVGNNNIDSTPCAKMKWEMMQQLFPGAIYAQYSTSTGKVIGTNNSIFSLVDCPPDTAWVTRYHPDSTLYHCYNPIGTFEDTVTEWSGTTDWGHDAWGHITLPDTCVTTSSYDAIANIHVVFYVGEEPHIMYGPIVTPNITGHLSISTTSHSLSTASGTIWSGSTSVGSISTDPALSDGYIQIPVHISSGAISATATYTLPDLSNTITFTLTGTTSYTDSMYRYTVPYLYDSLYGTDSAACLYRYQDTCTVASLPTSITINGNTYSNLRTMRADSFIAVYNEALAAGNYSIAEDLLPLHPQYCELKNCFDDTFKTQVLAIPTWQVAQSLGLLLLDSVVAHDPIKTLMTSSGLFPHPTDTLMTFPGGNIRVDSFLLINAYCGCSDSIMCRQCTSSMFYNEISHHLLVNSAVKKYYFNNVINAYFSNRQRIVDKLLMQGSPGCSHCALVRMSLDPAGALPPAAYTATSGSSDDTAFGGAAGSHWLPGMDTMGTTALSDSIAIAYHYTDSLLAYGEIDTIMAHLGNCVAGNPTIATRIRDTLYNMYHNGAAPMGNFTGQQIRYAIARSGATFNDLCNPYAINSSQLGQQPPAPVNDCNSAAFYTGIQNFLANYCVTGLEDYGVLYTYGIDTVTNLFGKSVARMLGNNNLVQIKATYDATQKLYRMVITTPVTGFAGDTVNLFLHSPVCGSLFLATGHTYSFSIACINSVPALANSPGLINTYSFLATVTDVPSSGPTTTCQMTGWADSIATMGYRDNNLSACVPCTQIKQLYTQFTDTLLAYGIYGSDHPYYDVMLTNFMNANLQQMFTADDYETFIQSCALADSMTMKLYTGYATFTFNSTAAMNAFITGLNGVDSHYSFDNSYRDSTFSGSPIIRVCVNLNSIPLQELWQYKQYLSSYSGAYSHIINQPFDTLLSSGEIGFFYTSTNAHYLFNPADSNIIDTTTVKFVGPYQKSVWIGGRFVPQNFYDVIAHSGTQPYTISKDVYQLSAYLYNHSIPGAVFIPTYQSTVNSDYFKPQKQAYLHFVYGNEQLPPYQVIDSIQSQYLASRISGWSTYIPGYSQASHPGVFTSLYLANTLMNNHYYDTLQNILTLSGSGGFIFPATNHVEISAVAAPRQLSVYRCSDGSYWYRYFNIGDTLYNAYIAFPDYIPAYQRPSYKFVGSVIPMAGDSLNRCFAINVVRTGTTDTLQITGRTSFVIGSSIELDNVLLGAAPGGVNVAGADTFDNCERQTLYSAINAGVDNYNNYMSHLRDSITGAFKSYVANSLNEQLLLGYMNNEFDYTLYNYDRAGNLSFTVPPAGTTPVPDTAHILSRTDTARLSNTPGMVPVYTKINNYNYNTRNQIINQQTIDGGKTRFFYDAAGRLIFSQNAKQGQQGYYTYNIYDHQNRIVETGEEQIGCPYFDPLYASFYSGSCYHSYYAYTSGGGPFGGVRVYLYTPDPYVVEFVSRIPADSVVWYIRSVNRRDVVMTVYDTVARRLDTITGLSAQQNLRKRVSCVKYFQSLAVTDAAAYAHYTYATHFSYDIDGNVQTLTHDFPALDPVRQRYKRVDYDYDLISGKVNMLSYNRGWPDQFYQHYTYDADNRITQVETSNDGYIWQQDARYTYYQHGPLARLQEGELDVQGIDYAYTIQGWMKAINSDTLNTSLDMGQDATGSSVTAKDAVAWTIDYFTNDYKPITARQVSYVQPVTRNLFNGNIARQTECIAAFQRLNKQYVYDQLNRIQSATYAGINPATNALVPISDFQNNYQYDMDGNIQKLVRYGNNLGSGALPMDSLIYNYTTGGMDNKLWQVYDYAPNSYPDSNDIKHYTTGAARYQYDAIGNTTKDLVNGQDTLKWNLYNKATGTVNNTASNYMSFTYDGADNRVAKYFTQNTPGGGYTENNNYYVRDAQGNILAIYREKEVYSTSPAGWITPAHAALRPAAGGTTPFIHNYVAPYLAPAEEFRNAILGYSLQSGAFAGGILSRPVSYFMSNSPNLYHSMLVATPAYLPVMVDSEKVAEGDTIIGPALTAQAVQDAPTATTFLAGLLGAPSEEAHILRMLCGVPHGSAILTSMVTAFNATDSTAGLSCDTMAAILTADSLDAWTLANAVVNALQQDSMALSQYMELVGIDSALYVDSFTSSFMNTGVQYALAGYGDQAKITSFFSSYPGTANILQQVTTPASLLTVAYNADPAAYLDTFTAILGTSYLDSATAALPGLSMLRYVYGAASALGVDPSPVLTPLLWLVNHQFGLAEHDFYGSTRLGIKSYYGDEVGYTWIPPNNFSDTIRLWKPMPWYSLEYQDVIKVDSVNLYGNTFTDMYFSQHVLGKKQYEITDHLGDVLATISDKRANDGLTSYSVPAGTLDTILTYKPVVIAAYDYYPFGEYMPSRYTHDSTTHCFNATLPELVHSIYITPIIPHRALRPVGGATLTDAADSVSVIFSVSAQGDGFAYDMTGLTPGMTASATIDLSKVDGKFVAMVTDDSTGAVLGSTNIFTTQGNAVEYSVPFTALSSAATLSLTSTSTAAGGGTVPVLGIPHDTILLENVVTLVCDEDWYRYGHNGQMKNNHVAGLGNWYEFKAREYSPRDIRFKSVDPLFAKYPWNGSYNFAEDRVIDGRDLEGLEYASFHIYVDFKSGYVTKINIVKDYDLKNKNTRGPGVEYVYHDNANGKVVPILGGYSNNKHGIYLGSDNPHLPQVGGKYTDKKDNYDLPPIDEADALAKKHDLDYDAQNIAGLFGILNKKSSKANEDFIKGADKIIDKYNKHQIDNVTGKPVTQEAKEGAEFGKKWFKKAEEIKSAKSVEQHIEKSKYLPPQ